ncbi:MAG: TetR family transcriptional regulator C-terminal domain-containing protein [Chryseolinea sp.]
METAKKSTKRSTAGNAEVKIKTAYVDYLLTHGKRPASIYKFCVDLGIKEDAFYTYVGSFDGLEKLVWKGFIDKVIHQLQGDESFSSFTTREKVLTFYYALLEELKQHRSFVLFQLEDLSRPVLVPEYIKSFKTSFELFFESILNTGKGNGEIATRPVIDKRYPQLFWMHMGFILLFWKKDDSCDFEKTDAAVEKSVNLAFDLIGKGAIDSAIDFAKFLYQTNK